LIEVGIVIADSAINVRAGPSTQNDIVTTLEPGTFVPIIGRNDAETWYEVELPEGGTGWIADFLLRIELITPDESETAPEAAEPTPTREGAFNLPDKGTVFARVVNQPEPTPEDGPPADESAPPSLDAQPTESFPEGGNLPPGIGEESTPDVIPEMTPEPTADATPEATPAVTPEVTEEPGLTISIPLGERDIVAPERDDDEFRDERWYSMTIGIIVAALIIGIGNLINVIRALRRRRRG